MFRKKNKPPVEVSSCGRVMQIKNVAMTCCSTDVVIVAYHDELIWNMGS